MSVNVTLLDDSSLEEVSLAAPQVPAIPTKTSKVCFADTDHGAPNKKKQLKKRIRKLSKTQKKQEKVVTLTESNLSLLDRYLSPFGSKPPQPAQPVYPMVAYTDNDENDDDNRTQTTSSCESQSSSSVVLADFFALPDLEYCKKAVGKSPYSALFKTRICAECGQCVHKYRRGGYTKEELIHENGEIETSLQGCLVETSATTDDPAAAATEKFYYHPACLQRKKDRKVHKENGYANAMRELQEVVAARNEQKDRTEEAKVRSSLDYLAENSQQVMRRRRKPSGSKSSSNFLKLNSFPHRFSLRRRKKPSVVECCRVSVNPTQNGHWERVWCAEDTIPSY